MKSTTWREAPPTTWAWQGSLFLLALIAVFSAGILVSMSLFGVALAGILSTRALQRVGQGAGALVGLSSIVLGVAWLATA